MKRAFTLIELLVVMALLGILTIITVSQFKTAIIKGRDSQRKADLSSLSKALLYYYADYHSFPASDDGFIDLGNGGLEWGVDEFKVIEDGKDYIYMKKLPKENSVGTKIFDYCYLSNGTSFQLYGQLENKEDKNIILFPPTKNNICGHDTQYYNFGYSSPDIKLEDNL